MTGEVWQPTGDGEQSAWRDVLRATGSSRKERPLCRRAKKHIRRELTRLGADHVEPKAIVRSVMKMGAANCTAYRWYNEVLTEREWAPEAGMGSGEPAPGATQHSPLPTPPQPPSQPCSPVPLGISPPPVAEDVRALRARLDLSQMNFAKAFGFSVGSVRQWESGRHRPEAAARVLLQVIADHPDVVRAAVAKLEPGSFDVATHAQK